MKNLIKPIVVLLMLSTATCFEALSMCHNEGSTAICVCKDERNITLRGMPEQEVTHIVVENCSIVYVPFSAILHVHVESIEFSDIDFLIISPFAFTGLLSVESLEISNVHHLIVHQHGFSGLYQISEIHIKNANFETLPPGAFSDIFNLESFTIEDCTFGLLRENSFIISNVSLVRFIDVVFTTFEEVPFSFYNVDDIVYENCEFKSTNNGTFTVSISDTLIFQNCTFETFGSTSIVAHRLGIFGIESCYIEELQTNAFASINITEKLVFKHNAVLRAQNNSLPFFENFHTPDVASEVCCSSFICDCELFWIWANEYDKAVTQSMMHTSRCTEYPAIKLSDLIPVINSNKSCESLKVNVSPVDGYESTSNSYPANKQPSTKKINNDNTSKVNSSVIDENLTKVSSSCLLSTELTNVNFLFFFLIFYCTERKFLNC